MKRKLFLLLCALLTMIGVQAQTAPKAGAIPVSGEEYYLYNIESGLYMNHGSSWGTHVTVDGAGDVIKVGGSEDAYTLHMATIDASKYVTEDGWSDNENAGKFKFAAASKDGYTNVYQIQIASNTANGYYWGEALGQYGNECWVNTLSEHPDASLWLFIPKSTRQNTESAAKSNPIDVTYMLTNPDFDARALEWNQTSNDYGWTGDLGKNNWANENQVTYYSGQFNEYWVGAPAAVGDMKRSQSKVFPSGKYNLSVTANAELQSFAGVEQTGTYIYAGANQTTIGLWGTYTVSFISDGETPVEFGVKTVSATANWVSFDKFRLAYLGEDLSDYVTAYHEARDAANAVDQSAPMLGTALTALQTAISTYGSGVDEESKSALLEATSALGTAALNANTSIAAYAGVSAAVSAANAIKTNHNFASTEAIATFTSAISNISDKYDARTLANEEASNAAVTLGTAISGWHGNANGAASKYLNNGFGLNDFDAALYVNTWSIEGETDGSNFKVPFYEYWVADANSLTEKTWVGEVTVPTGQYQISALVRVRAKNGVAPADAKGISMQVTDGDAVDVTEGTQVGESQFQLKEYEAIGLVKDGKLKFNMIIAADNNISWLSFKNVKYTKLRDLTPEEAAIAPEDLSLEATKTVFRAKTVTLTPTSSTEGASIAGYTTWESDNTDVATVDANGVVTGVGYGTANITVTSTLNTSATATCAVTVDAPTLAELENLDFTEGPVVEAHIRTYAKDKKGTDVAQMQPVSGWAMGVANGDAKAAGVMAYGSSYGMGSDDASFYAPATNPQGEASGDALGMVGVWTGSVQYVQYVKLDPGAYTIYVPVYRNGGASALTKNLIGVILDDNTEYLAKTTVYAANEWTTERIKFTLASETYAKLSAGLNAPNTGSANSQRLWIDGFTIAYEPLADADDYAALNAAIETAEGYTLGFEDGEYAPYNNIDAQMALVNAKAVDQSAPNAKFDIETITNDVLTSWTANSGDVEAVYNGNFAEGQGSAPEEIEQYGWNRTNVWGQFRDDVYGSTTGYYNQPGSLQYGNAGYYTMPLKANMVYRLQFQYGAWDGAPQPTVSVLNEEKGMAAQVFDATSVSYKEGLTSVDMLFVTADAGNYILTLANSGNIVFTGASITKAASQTLTITDGEELPKFAPGTYPSATYSRSLTLGNKWGTICLPFNLKSDENIQFYTVSSIGSGVLNVETTDAVAAGVPAIFKKLTSENSISVTTNEATVVSAPAEAESGTNAKLVGTFTGTTIEGESAGNYFYVKTDQFWRGNGNFSIPAYRAYIEDLSATNPGARLVINVDGEDPTAINVIEAAEAEEGTLKDGKYLINGKVVLVKNGVKYSANGQKLN
jgi:hypothetical protein